MTPSSAARGHVWLVGAGPGDPALVTVAGLEALRRAEVVVYDRLAPHALLEECAPDAVLIDAGKAADNHTLTQREINDALIAHARSGRRVVRLKGGDPYVFGRGGEEALALGIAGIACTVVPGVTAAIAGLAAAGIPITHRGLASSFAVITAHEDPTKPEASVDWSRLATAADTLVMLMGVGRIEGIAAALIEGGRAPSTPSALVQQATTPRQRVVTAPLDRIASAARDAGIEAPALFVVGEVVSLQGPLTEAAGPLAGKRVLVTRTRSQASSLASLLRAEGAYPVLLPAIELERRAEAGAFARPLERLRAAEYAWAVFTSANAVEATFELLRELEADARAFAACRIAAIGAATARALEARGLRADLVPPEALGGSVVEALTVDAGVLEGRRVLLPRAEGAREVLPDGLRAAGAEVDEVRLYFAAPPAAPSPEALALLRDGQIDAVTFTSSSTVRNLATLLAEDHTALEGLRGALIACIGPATAQAAIEAGLPPDVTAEESSVSGLVAALRDAFARRPRTATSVYASASTQEVAP